MLGTKPLRFAEPQKFLPVVFVSVMIAFLAASYISVHCWPLLRTRGGSAGEAAAARTRGAVELCLFVYLFVMLVICYVRSILTHPGSIPNDDPEWDYQLDSRPGSVWVPASLQETKKTGERRHCKWCGKYKPDRCHHCRVCKSCILKMDHHCPWIYNCVGFENYKFFFLLLLYSMLSSHLIVWTMTESVQSVILEQETTHFSFMFLTFFTVTLAFFMAVLVTTFFAYHVWLVANAMTTIEFCEKSQPKRPGEGRLLDEASAYTLGLWGNIRAVLGPRPLLWFFPCSGPEGDGLNFVSEETRLTRDAESGSRGVRKRTHQSTQRPPTFGLDPWAQGLYAEMGPGAVY